MGGRRQAAGGVGGNMGVENIRPIFQVNMPPPLPAPSVDQMDMAFHRGAECQKRHSETVVPVGDKIHGQAVSAFVGFFVGWIRRSRVCYPRFGLTYNPQKIGMMRV